MDPATLSLASSLGGGLVEGLGSFLGNQSKANAAADAAEAYAKYANDALNFQKGVYNTASSQYNPYITAGTEGLGKYQNAVENYKQPTLNYNQSTFDLSNWQDPGYQYRMDQANKAINASTASKGMTLGSGALKALQTKNQDMASQEYQNAYDRWKNTSQMLYGQASDQYKRDYDYANQNIANLGNLSTMGQNAIGSLAGVGQNVGSQLSQNLTGMGNMYGNAALAQGGANAAGWNTLGSGLSTGISDIAKYYGAK